MESNFWDLFNLSSTFLSLSILDDRTDIVFLWICSKLYHVETSSNSFKMFSFLPIFLQPTHNFGDKLQILAVEHCIQIAKHFIVGGRDLMRYYNTMWCYSNWPMELFQSNKEKNICINKGSIEIEYRIFRYSEIENTYPFICVRLISVLKKKHTVLRAILFELQRHTFIFVYADNNKNNESSCTRYS